MNFSDELVWRINIQHTFELTNRFDKLKQTRLTASRYNYSYPINHLKCRKIDVEYYYRFVVISNNRILLAIYVHWSNIAIGLAFFVTSPPVYVKCLLYVYCYFTSTLTVNNIILRPNPIQSKIKRTCCKIIYLQNFMDPLCTVTDKRLCDKL